MARKVTKRDCRYIAKLVTADRAPCAFCHRELDDEVTYGKLYAIGDIQCHYFCVLLSCCLVQKGHDEDGLFGFMYKDILAELERSKKHKCSFCGRGGASLGCSVASCRKQFHLPCGRERDVVSLYYGTYKSFCQIHAPKQKLPEHIMNKAKLRMRDKNAKAKGTTRSKELVRNDSTEDDAMLCVICYESVDAFPTVNTFWPVCCARDAWLHRSCLQRMALSAGMHYLKCPLCNDKAHFYDAVVSQGYYVPDRDAAWELEQNAFAEIYERPLTCTAESCQCPLGRSHDADQGMWDIKLCLLCGSVGAHASCIGASETTRYICLTCTPAAPKDIQALADTIEELILQEQANSNVRRGPIMPSRMSLRRTKGRTAILNTPSTSRPHDVNTECKTAQSPNIEASRQELNLKTPKKPSTHTEYTHKYDYIEAKLLSPMKLLEERFKEKVLRMGVKNAVLDEKIVEVLKKKFSRPRPLSAKKKIVEAILDGLFVELDSNKQKEPVKEICSPTKCYEILEERQENQSANENVRTPKKNTMLVNNLETTLKLNESRADAKVEEKEKLNIDPIYEDEQNIEDQNEVKKIDGDNYQNNNNSEGHPNDIQDHFFNDKVIDDCYVAFGTPKRKTIDMNQDSSLEISEQDQSISIAVIKIDDTSVKTKKYAFNLGLSDKENLGRNKLDIDMESFKNEYLNEVGREFTRNNNQLNKSLELNNMRSTKDFTVHDVDEKKEKCGMEKGTDEKRRKRKNSDGSLLLNFNLAKRRKTSESDLNLKSNINYELLKNDKVDKAINDISKHKTQTIDEIKTKSGSEDVENSKGTEDINVIEKLARDKEFTDSSVPNQKESKKGSTREFKTKESKREVKTRKYIDSKRVRQNESKLVRRERRVKEKRDNRRDRLDKCTKRLKNRELEGDFKLDKVIKQERDEKQVKGRSEDEINVTENSRVNDRKVKIKQERVKKEKNREKHGKHKEKYKDITDKGNFEVTINSTKRKNKRTKDKTKLSIRNVEKDISVKIKWKEEQLELKIKSKKEKTIEKDYNTKFKQYVLQYFSEVSPKDILVKPEKEVSPLKRKYNKQLKSPDNFKQMSIENFFKVKSNEH